MPFPIKIQPMDPGSMARIDPSKTKPSLLRRFFGPRAAASAPLTKADGQVTASPPKADVDKDSDDSGGGQEKEDVDCSKSLNTMVVSYFEESTETNKPPKNRCGSCFNGNTNEEDSDEEVDLQYADVVPVAPPPGETFELVRSLVPCATVTERNLLADVSRIMDRTKSLKCRRSEVRKVVVDGLKSLGYDAAVCKSKWEKTGSIPGGVHEYIDVLIGGARLLVEIDFRSEFEVARLSEKYASVLRSLPSIYVGTADRMAKIIVLAAEALKRSMRDTGMTYTPWRKPEYMKAKWLSHHVRLGMEGSKLPGRDISVNFEVCRAERITFMVRPSEVVIGKLKKKQVAGLTAVL